MFSYTTNTQMHCRHSVIALPIYDSTFNYQPKVLTNIALPMYNKTIKKNEKNAYFLALDSLIIQIFMKIILHNSMYVF